MNLRSRERLLVKLRNAFRCHFNLDLLESCREADSPIELECVYYIGGFVRGRGLVFLTRHLGVLSEVGFLKQIQSLSSAQKEHIRRWMPEVALHLFVVTEQIEVPNFGVKGLYDYRVYEPKITGIIYKYNSKKVDVHPFLAIDRNMSSAHVRHFVAEKLRCAPSQISKMQDLTVVLYRGVHIGESEDQSSEHTFLRGWRQGKTQLSQDLVSERLKLISHWYSQAARNQWIDYRYSVVTDTNLDSDRTLIRGVLALGTLGKLSQCLDDNELRDLFVRSLEFQFSQMFSSCKTAEGVVSLRSSEHSFFKGQVIKERWPLASVFLSAIVDGRHESYYHYAQGLIRWMDPFVSEEGKVYSPSGLDQYFMPGQYCSGLVAYLVRQPNEAIMKQVLKVLRFYQAINEAMARFGPEDYAPAIAPQWLILPMSRLSTEFGIQEFDSYILDCCDKILMWGEKNRLGHRYPDYHGILVPLAERHFGNVSVTAASLEALFEGWRVASRRRDQNRIEKYLKQISETVKYILNLQYTNENLYYSRNPQRALGGIATDLIDSNIWMDNVWHFSNVLMKMREDKVFWDELSLIDF